MIDEKCLRSHGAILRKFTRNTVLFNEGQEPEYHFQMVSGIVEFVRVDLDGLRTTCKFLTGGDANYIVLNDSPLSFDIVAVTDCTVLVMSKENFLSMIKSEKGMLRHIMEFLARELNTQMETNSKAYRKSPADRITELFQSLKYEETDQEIYSLVVSLDLNEIALMCGISVEICIATIQKMELENSIRIRNGRIYY